MPRVPHTSSGPLAGSMCPPLTCPLSMSHPPEMYSPEASSWTVEGVWLCLERSGKIMPWTMPPGLSLKVDWAWGVARTPCRGGPGTSVGHSALPCWKQSVNTEAFPGDLPSMYLVKIIKRKSASHSPNRLSPFSKGISFFIFCFWTEHCSVDTSLSLSLASQSSVSFFREFFRRSSQTETYTTVPSKGISPQFFPVSCCSNNSGWRVPSQLWFFCRGLLKVDISWDEGTDRAREFMMMPLNLQDMWRQNFSIMTPPWRTFPPNLPT